MFTIKRGRDLPKRKPDPGLFLLAAAALKIPPVKCFLVEDSPAGVEAAGRGSMTVVGVGRLNDSDLLRAVGADRVVTSLDEIDIDDIAMGRLSRRTA